MSNENQTVNGFDLLVSHVQATQYAAKLIVDELSISNPTFPNRLIDELQGWASQDHPMSSARCEAVETLVKLMRSPT